MRTVRELRHAAPAAGGVRPGVGAQPDRRRAWISRDGLRMYVTYAENFSLKTTLATRYAREPRGAVPRGARRQPRPPRVQGAHAERRLSARRTSRSSRCDRARHRHLLCDLAPARPHPWGALLKVDALSTAGQDERRRWRRRQGAVLVEGRRLFRAHARFDEPTCSARLSLCVGILPGRGQRGVLTSTAAHLLLRERRAKYASSAPTAPTLRLPPSPTRSRPPRSIPGSDRGLLPGAVARDAGLYDASNQPWSPAATRSGARASAAMPRARSAIIPCRPVSAVRTACTATPS